MFSSSVMPGKKEKKRKQKMLLLKEPVRRASVQHASVAVGAAAARLSVLLFGINVLISERGGTGGWENSLYSQYNQAQLWQSVTVLYYSATKCIIEEVRPSTSAQDEATSTASASVLNEFMWTKLSTTDCEVTDDDRRATGHFRVMGNY